MRESLDDYRNVTGRTEISTMQLRVLLDIGHELERIGDALEDDGGVTD